MCGSTPDRAAPGDVGEPVAEVETALGGADAGRRRAAADAERTVVLPYLPGRSTTRILARRT
jgi:hypothetical protein